MQREKALIFGNNYRSSVLIFPIAILAVLLNAYPSSNTRPPEPLQYSGTLIPLKLLPKLTLGYQNAYASVLWLKTISYYGGKLENSDFTHIAQLLETITDLNHRAEHAYYMAATILPWSTSSTALSSPLVNKAMLYFPSDWRWPYYRGFNAYWFDHDFKEAGTLLTRAAKLPLAPPIIASLALRMQAEAGQLDTGLLFLENLIREQQDKSIRNGLLKQRKVILTEKELRTLEQALATLPKQHHDRRDLIALQELGYPVPSRLADGGHIIFKENGQIISSVSRNRFKVYVPPRIQNKRKGSPEK